jgi:hypothetical protein
LIEFVFLFEVVHKSLLEIAGNYLLEKQALVLNCDTVWNGNKAGLVFSTSGTISQQNLYSSQHTVWNSSGISSLWDSVTLKNVPKTAKRG